MARCTGLDVVGQFLALLFSMSCLPARMVRASSVPYIIKVTAVIVFLVLGITHDRWRDGDISDPISLASRWRSIVHGFGGI